MKHFKVALLLTMLPAIAFAADFDIGGIITTIAAFKEPQVLAFTLFAFAGVLVHVEVDIRKGLIATAESGSWWRTLFNYMFMKRLTSTIAMIVAAAGLGITYLAVTPQPISWIQLILAAATAGYTSDSLFNRAA